MHHVDTGNELGLASIDAAKVSTQGNPGTGSAASSASVLDASIAGLVSRSVARSSCSATADGTEGSASLADLVLAGIPISTVDLGPNTTIALPVGNVIINEQRSDGASGLTVNAVHVRLNALVVTGDIVIGQSRCAVNSATRARSTRLRRAKASRRAKAAGRSKATMGSQTARRSR